MTSVSIRKDALAGITITLALIPDAIAFSFIAGVNPMIGLFSTIILMIVISFCGARPAMVSSAAGSMAVLMAPLVVAFGVEYLFAATILTGILQFVMGFFKLGRWMNFVPHAVIAGFINALAILIFMDQLKHLKQGSLLMYLIVAGTLGLIYLIPRITKAIPSPLVAVVFITLLVLVFKLPLETLGDHTTILNVLPIPGLPKGVFNLTALWVILPFSISLALVGYTETLLTQTMIDELTNEHTDKNKELKGQGIANAISGLFGGMAGCALVAESIIHVKLGARGRLSTLISGLFLLSLVLLFGNVVKIIPVAALVGVMLMICYEIFDWKSIFNSKQVPFTETVVMLVTAITGILTHNLAIGTLAGVAVSMIIYVYKTSKLQLRIGELNEERIYSISGPLFFVSAKELSDKINQDSRYEKVVIDLSHAYVWDHSARLTLQRIYTKLEDNGIAVRVIEAQ